MPCAPAFCLRLCGGCVGKGGLHFALASGSVLRSLPPAEAKRWALLELGLSHPLQGSQRAAAGLWQGTDLFPWDWAPGSASVCGRLGGSALFLVHRCLGPSGLPHPSAPPSTKTKTEMSGTVSVRTWESSQMHSHIPLVSKSCRLTAEGTGPHLLSLTHSCHHLGRGPTHPRFLWWPDLPPLLPPCCPQATLHTAAVDHSPPAPWLPPGHPSEHQNFLFSQVWRLEVPGQGVGRVGFFQVLSPSACR